MIFLRLKVHVRAPHEQQRDPGGPGAERARVHAVHRGVLEAYVLLRPSVPSRHHEEPQGPHARVCDPADRRECGGHRRRRVVLRPDPRPQMGSFRH